MLERGSGVVRGDEGQTWDAALGVDAMSCDHASGLGESESSAELFGAVSG